MLCSVEEVLLCKMRKYAKQRLHQVTANARLAHLCAVVPVNQGTAL